MLQRKNERSHGAWITQWFSSLLPVVSAIGLSTVGLLLAVCLSAGFQSNQISVANDYVTPPFVDEGQQYDWGPLCEISLSNLQESQKESVLHFQCLAIGQPVHRSEQDIDCETTSVHCAELQARIFEEGEVNSIFVCRVTFERSWESSFSTDQKFVFEPSVTSDVQLFNSPSVPLMHVGERYCSRKTTAELIGGMDSLLMKSRVESPALLNLSSFCGKTIRLHCSAAGKVVAVQPIGCTLSMHETEWLHTNMLPRVSQALGLNGNGKALSISPSQMRRLFPYDLGIASEMHSDARCICSFSASSESSAISWCEDHLPKENPAPKSMLGDSNTRGISRVAKMFFILSLAFQATR